MVPLIFPVHPRTRQKLSQLSIHSHPNLRLIDPLGYLEFICLLSHAQIVLTDSGGVQEETTALAIPCLTLRENTERPVTVTKGTNHIVGHDFEKIKTKVREILGGHGKKGERPELWDGHAAQRIVEILLHEIS
jgi:UDP-N-acetylglucosamine 2-epimerase (non-hydrolysing)